MKRRQRGVALLVVLLILALMVTMSTTIAERNGRAWQRTMAQVERLRAKWYARSAESLAAKILQRDASGSPNKTDLAQKWAQGPRRFTIDDGEVSGLIVDGQACFNLNAINQGGAGEGRQSTLPYSRQVFRQLLINLGAGALRATQITAALSDWIDSDNAPGIEGSEDARDRPQSAPYLPAHQPMQDISELRTVSGVDAELYRRLLPYVCVLPVQTLSININTLSESQSPLFAALFVGELDPAGAMKLLQQRPHGGWNSTTEFLAQEALKDRDTSAIKYVLTVKSDLFFADFNVQVGDIHYSQRSLLSKSGHRFQVIRRQPGFSMLREP
ncbi:type II secretion system minor pseudopilin GspK [Klebsiella michiganensis]|nr:type II secretion system minor pseudopilin GspK [Klebsiella michiganensis]